jgi:hypothetical protein
MKYLLLLLLPLQVCAQETQRWNITAMKGTQVFFASHIGVADASNIKPHQREILMRAMVDNSNMPPMSAPESIVTNMGASSITVRWSQSSSKDHTDPAGIAVIKYPAGEDGMIAYRAGHTETYMLNSDKVTQVYTIHRNVRMPDGGYLVTVTGVRNSFIGVTSMNFSGSAHLAK